MPPGTHDIVFHAVHVFPNLRLLESQEFRLWTPKQDLSYTVISQSIQPVFHPETQSSPQSTTSLPGILARWANNTYKRDNQNLKSRCPDPITEAQMRQ